MQKIGGLILQS